MAKEWILNSAMNRFQFNFSRNVGSVAEEIRKCSPRTIDDWEKYYFGKVRAKDHIEELGRKLYIKITEVIAAEVEDIKEEDCIKYMLEMVINRTYQGYVTEIQTIYGQLQEILKVKIEPASDEWDRLYNVDFFIKVKDAHVGLQIKPAGGVSHIPEIFKERSLQAATHEKFTKKYGGKVFYIISVKDGDKKRIQNVEVVDEIAAEIKKLSK
jgi:hypothetical protein